MDVPAKAPSGATSRVRPWRQDAILDAIRASYERDGRPPTLEEIRVSTGMSSISVVSYNLHRLQEEGLVTVENGVSRGIRLVLQEGDACPVCGRAGP